MAFSSARSLSSSAQRVATTGVSPRGAASPPPAAAALRAVPTSRRPAPAPRRPARPQGTSGDAVHAKSNTYFASPQPTADRHAAGQEARQQADAGQLRALHLPQQRAARAHRPHDGELARALLARGGDGGEQHHQPRRQREAEQEFHRADHLVQHRLHLVDGAGHVDVGDVGKAAHQRVVEAGLLGRAEGAHVGDRHVGQLADREHDEEVGAHRAPVDLAQRRDLGLGLQAADVEAQRVAQLQAQRLRDALLDAGAAGSSGVQRPPPLVVRRLGGAVGQVELAVDQALGAVLGVVVGTDLAPVHRHQPAADHRVPVVALHAGVAQRLLERVALLRHHVDDEAVRRVRRRGLAPAGDQVGAQQHQQHQRQQADRQRTDLHHRIDGPGRQLPRGQHQPARRRRLVHRRAQHLHRQPAQRREQQHRAGEAADRDGAQLQVAAGRDQQGGEAEPRRCPAPRRRRLEVADVAPDHAQRRHLRQLQHRRQAEGEQQRQPHAQAEGHRPQAGRGQAGFDQPASSNEHEVHREAERHAQRAGGQADSANSKA
jgi:hypothetical protein